MFKLGVTEISRTVTEELNYYWIFSVIHDYFIRYNIEWEKFH